jgi:hypothetical protein
VCYRKGETLILTSICQGLVTNGAKVYVVALPSEPIEEKVSELNEIGRPTGGSAIGQSKISLMFRLSC